MGRDLKRVPLDFNWPLKKTWEGFINPHYKRCPEEGKTCFHGQNAAATYLEHLTSMFCVVADSAARGQNHPYIETLPYLGDHPDWSKQPKEIRQRFVDLVCKLVDMKQPSYMGFCGQGHAIFFKLLELAGIKNTREDNNPAYEWTHCLTCNGSGIDPAVKKEHDAWKDYEPPNGDGFQLWESTSEGSPVSPVFKTLDDLCAWCEKHATTFADNKASASEWKKMLEEDNVHHKDGNMIFI